DELRPDVETGSRAVREPAAHLHGNRERDRACDGVDDRACAPRLLETVGARARLRHLAHRAAEVDVDDVRPGVLDHAGSLGHHCWLGAEDLDRERMLVGGDAQVAERALVLVREARAADHLRADEPRTEAPPLPAEGLHADSGHGRENEAGGDLHAADSPGFAQIYLHRGRIVAADPELTLAEGLGTMLASRRRIAPRIFSEEARKVKEVILTPEGYKKLKEET